MYNIKLRRITVKEKEEMSSCKDAHEMKKQEMSSCKDVHEMKKEEMSSCKDVHEMKKGYTT